MGLKFSFSTCDKHEKSTNVQNIRINIYKINTFELKEQKSKEK